MSAVGGACHVFLAAGPTQRSASCSSAQGLRKSAPGESLRWPDEKLEDEKQTLNGFKMFKLIRVRCKNRPYGICVFFLVPVSLTAVSLMISFFLQAVQIHEPKLYQVYTISFVLIRGVPHKMATADRSIGCTASDTST